METLEEYNLRIRNGESFELGRTIVVDPDGTSTIVQEYMTVTTIEPEQTAVVLLRDLGTLTPLRELGRGRP